jgi:hypothetical protein
MALGYQNVAWYPDGTDGWESAKLPLQETKPEPTTVATPGFFRCFATASPACRLLARRVISRHTSAFVQPGQSLELKAPLFATLLGSEPADDGKSEQHDNEELEKGCHDTIGAFRCSKVSVQKPYCS